MPYIGRELNRGNYLKLDDISSQFNGSLTTFNLTNGGVAFFPGSSLSILVTLNGVLQEAGRNFSIDQSQITFVNPPASGVFFSCVVLGLALNFNSVPNNSIGGQQLSLPFTYDQFFHLDSTNNRVGIGTLVPASTLDVKGTSTFSGPISVANTISLGDDDKIILGDGDDLKIYHDGANSYVQESGTGALRLVGNQVAIRNNAENMAVFNTNADVKLYYDNSEKFETTGIGISVVNGTSDTATISGPSNLVIDPVVVGNNTGVVRIKGDLFVDGTTTQINSTTLEISDFVVGIASTATTDLLADGAGIKIGPDNTLLYEHNGGTNPSLKSSENLNVASGKGYQIAETERLSIDTLSLGTGTTIHSPASNVLTLGTNSEERLRITSDGDIGIGTDNPGAKFEIAGTGASAIRLRDLDGASQFGQILSNNGILVLESRNDNSDGQIVFRGRDNTGTNDYGRFDENGNFGIGTNNPDTLLDLFGTGNTTIKVHNNSAAVGTYSRLQLVTGGSGSSARSEIRSLRMSTTSAATNLALFTTTAGDTSPTERLRITSDGKFGFGTNNPQGIVHISSGTSGDATLILEADTDNNNEADNPNIIFRQDGGLNLGAIGMNLTNSSSISPSNELYVAASSADAAIVFATGTTNGYTNAIERLRITSDGKVGINESSPDTVLDVNSDGTAGIIQLTGARPSDSNNAFFSGRSSRGTIASPTTLVTNDIIATFQGKAHDGSNYLQAGRVRFVVDSISTGNLSSNLQFILSNNGEFEAMRINSDGRFGFGTGSSIDERGHIETASGNCRLKLQTGNTAVAGFVLQTSAKRFDVQAQNNFFHIYDSTAATERLRITSDGKVGIGTNNPDQELHVIGQIKVSDSNYARTEYARNNTNLWSVGLRDTDDLFFYRESGSANVIFQHGKVGINSTAPEAGLDVRSDDGIFVKTATNAPTNGARIQFTDQVSSDQRGFIRYKHSNNAVSPGSTDGFFIGGTETLTVVRVEGRALIDEKVGIGTDNPSAKLHVAGSVLFGPDGTSNQYQGLSFRHGRDSSANIATGFIDFRNNLNVADAHMFVDHQTDGGSTMIFGTTPAGDRTTNRRAERLRIGSAGQIGLGGANYGSSGQVLTSNGASSAPTWQDASGGGGGGTQIVNGTSNVSVAQDGDITMTRAGSLKMTVKASDIRFGSMRLRVSDGGKFEAGDSSDLLMYHDGSNAYFENATGMVLNRIPAGQLFAIQKTGGTENIAIFNADGACEFYHNNNQRILTTTSGVDLKGQTTIKNFNGTGLKLEGSGGNYQGMQLQVTDASASQTRNIFIDAINESGAAVANQVGSIQSDGGSHWSWQTQPPGSRTDRRVERLRITSTGNIGINEQNPVAKLHIDGTGTAPCLVLPDSTNSRYSVGFGNVHVPQVGQRLDFYVGDSGSNTSNLTSAHRRMSLTTQGRLGIGTDTPSRKFEVHTTQGSTTGKIFEVDRTTFSVNQFANEWTSLDQTPNPVLAWNFKSGPGDMMYMSSGGNTPIAQQMALVISDGHGFKVGKSGYDGSEVDVDSSNEFFRITNSGNVVIGTTSALGKLHVRAADECNFVVREESTALVLSAETNSGRDNNRQMSLEGNAFSFTLSGNERFKMHSNGTYSQEAGSFSDNLTYGGRTFTVNHDIRATSMRGGVLVRNMNDFRSETNAASFMVYDAYDTSSKTFAFRVATGATLSDKFWVKTDGSMYAANTFSGNSISLTSNITQTAAAPQHIFKETGSASGNTHWAIVRDSDNISIRWNNASPYAFSSQTIMGTLQNVQLKGGQLIIDSGNKLDAICVYNFTTSAGANVNVASSGLVRRSTSSAKYKTNVEPIEDKYSDALLNCRPVYYRSTCEGDNPDYGWWGFIAEEVAEIDPRLVYYKEVDVELDGEGGKTETPCEPEPEGVAYDRFVPHLLNLIKRQKQTIETLESKVDGLLDRITALEGG